MDAHSQQHPNHLGVWGGQLGRHDSYRLPESMVVKEEILKMREPSDDSKEPRKDFGTEIDTCLYLVDS
jgi:hypothetical protein